MKMPPPEPRPAWVGLSESWPEHVARTARVARERARELRLPVADVSPETWELHGPLLYHLKLEEFRRRVLDLPGAGCA